MKRAFLCLIITVLNLSVIQGQVCPDKIDCSNAYPMGQYFEQDRIRFSNELEFGGTLPTSVPTPYSLSLISPLGQIVSGENYGFESPTGGNYGSFSTAICIYETPNAYPDNPRTAFTGYVEFKDEEIGELRRCYYELGDLSDACTVAPNDIYCETGDFDGDNVLNGDDSHPEDPCLPNNDSVACDTGDNDNDGVSNNEDADPDDPCIPNTNASACLNLDTDGDGYPDIIDPQPNNPDWPVEIVSLGCTDLIEECPVSLLSIVSEVIGEPSECIQWNGSCSTTGQIYRQGKVSLGTSIFTDKFSLIVKGGILTEQFKVCTTGWCDYVFYKDYPLMDLTNVKLFVEKYNHLPAMPSEKELIEKGGIDLGEMTLMQQEKLEESYLHLFNIDEKISKIERKLSVLEQD